MTCGMKSRHYIKREMWQIFQAVILITWKVGIEYSQIGQTFQAALRSLDIALKEK